MNFELFLIVVVNIIAIFAVGLWLASQLRKATPAKDEEEQRSILKSLVNEVFGEVAGKITEQSKRVLAGEKEIITTDLKNKQEQIEKVVGELRREINQRNTELQQLEQKRGEQFSQIAEQIKQHQEIVKDLRGSTEKLSSVLSNNQKRGGWGEKVLDDILRSAGLVAGVHYVRQEKLDDGDKPDITLLLPNKRVVAVDVKFPYAAAQKMAEAETTDEKRLARKQFLTDVRGKISQVAKYINPEKGTLDYAILFVPNELLFSFINQNAPEVIEEAMSKKVMIVSPFTFLIVARTVLESYRNFMLENHLRDIVRHIGDFIQEWGRFEGEFNKFDDDITKLRKSYDQITTTRYKQMDLRIRRIEDYRHGMLDEGKTESLPEGQTLQA